MQREDKRENKISVIKNNALILGKILRFSPGMLIGKLLFTIMNHLLAPMSSVVLLRYVIDTVGKQGGASKVTAAVCLFAAAATGISVSSCLFTNRYLPVAEENFRCRLKYQLYQKAAGADLRCYDDPAFYDSLTMSVSSVEERFLSVLEIVCQFAGRFANLVCVAAVLLSVDLSIAGILALSLAVNMALSRRAADCSVQRAVALNPLQRRERYLSDCFRLGEYAKELRVGQMGERLAGMYRRNNRETVEVNRQYAPWLWGLSLVQDGVGNLLLVHGALLLYLCYQCASLHRISVGDFAAVFNGVVMALEALIFLASEVPAQLRENAGYVEKYKTFMALEPQVKSGGRSFAMPRIIAFEHVSFSYDKKTPVLRDVSFTWQVGERLALVGYNGSGKSTLIKLLLRFYDPDEGRITADGVDIREFSLEEYRQSFVTVFQDYQLYAAKLGQNLSMAQEYDREQAAESLARSGFAASYVSPEGEPLSALLEREVGQEFGGGLRMSQGQSQQAAIGRVYYHAGAFAVLDEPSAALDPMLEEQLNTQLLSDTLREGRGVLLVSHRLSSTVAADHILLLENGRIAESGIHQELMKRGGVYAEFFEMQAKEYLE